MANTHNAVSVRDYLKLFVEQGNIYTVDEMSYVHDAKNNERLPLSRADGTTGYLTIYDPAQVNTDVIPFNPFVEGLEISKDKQWFYQTRTMCLGGVLYRIMEAIINGVVIAKDRKKTEEGDDPSHVAMVKAIAPFAQDDIDSKTIGELNEIVKSMTNFFNIFYSHREKQCVLNVGVFESNFVGSFGTKIRKKTWPVFKKIVATLLRSENPREDYKTKSSVSGCPNFSAYANIYVRVLETIEPYLFLQQRQFDIPTLKSHLPKLGEYYNTAKFYVGPTTPVDPTASKTQTAPWGTPFAAAAGVPMLNGTMSPFGMMPATPGMPAMGAPLVTSASPADVSGAVASPLLGGPKSATPASNTPVVVGHGQPAALPTETAMNAMLPTASVPTVSAMSPLAAAMPQMQVQPGVPMMPMGGGFPMMAANPGVMMPMQPNGMMAPMAPVLPGMPMGYQQPVAAASPIMHMQATMITAPAYGGGMMYQPAPPTTMVQVGGTGVTIESPLTADGNRVNSPLI